MKNSGPTPVFALLRGTALALMLASLGAVAVRAQTAQGVPNAVQGFSQNRDKPINIEAGALEVRDKDRVATFSGDVKVVQGDTTMRSRTLQVFYDQQAPQATKGTQAPAKSVMPGPAGGNSQIRRLEAKGGVIVTQQDQTVTGDSGVFDMRENTVTMLGGVVLTKGQNVVRGDRLIVNLATGNSKVEMNHGGRIKALIDTKSDGGKGSFPMPGQKKDGAAAQDAAKDPGKPLRLNASPAYSRPAG